MPHHEFYVVTKMTDAMRDLCSTTFFVPMIDKHSPLAYSIINEVHWYNKVANHSGVETVLRYTLKYGYIIEGQELVKMIRKRCERCRYKKNDRCVNGCRFKTQPHYRSCILRRFGRAL